jgi:AraC family transcriptional regulator, positive regulator of tynA and feaB
LAGSAHSSCVENAPRAATTHARVDIWSTDAAAARERFSYWREAICQSMFNITIEAPPERFSARLHARSAGPLRFASAQSSAYKVARSRRDIDGAPADYCTIYLQLDGRTIFEQDGHVCAVERGDIALWDGRHPFRFGFSEAAERAVAIIPRAMIERRAPWLRRRPLHRLAADRPFIDLARRHLAALTADNWTFSENEATLLTDNLCNLLALATAKDLGPSRLDPELQLEALLAFCRQNLHNTELSPQLAADHLGISVRTLHLRFQKAGQSFGRWVLDNRLDACRATLRDPRQRASNISEIAYRWGFNDLSYFNKAFRARFNETPREARMGAEG